MKVSLEFNLPEDKEDFELAYNGHKYKFIIDDIWQELRRLSKYTETESLNLEEIRDMIRNITKNYEE